VLQTDASLSGSISINAQLSGLGAPTIQAEEVLANSNGVITVKPVRVFLTAATSFHCVLFVPRRSKWCSNCWEKNFNQRFLGSQSPI
jgi:hypothetical protein